MINHISILTNPKGSNVYRKICIGFYTTPSGSHILESSFFYKHQIPSGLLETTSTLKGSNAYSNDCGGFCATPKGSYDKSLSIFYKHQIPSGLLLESIEADIQKGINELKQMI